MKLFLPLAAVVIVSLTACDSGYLFQSEREFADGQWTYRDTVDFRFEIKDTGAVYNLYLDFAHNATFENQNVYLKIYTLFPNGRRLTTMRGFDFFSAQGESMGKCSGEKCRLRASLQENAYFNQSGEYMITLEQFTRRDTLPGVWSVGLAVQPTKERRPAPAGK